MYQQKMKKGAMYMKATKAPMIDAFGVKGVGLLRDTATRFGLVKLQTTSVITLAAKTSRLRMTEWKTFIAPAQANMAIAERLVRAEDGFCGGESVPKVHGLIEWKYL